MEEQFTLTFQKRKGSNVEGKGKNSVNNEDMTPLVFPFGVLEGIREIRPHLPRQEEGAS